MDTIEPQINEIILRQNDEWLYFSHPHRVIEIHNRDDVIQALQEIEDLVNKNDSHAAGFVCYEAAPAFDRALVTRASTSLIDEHSSLRYPASTMSGREDFPLLWFGLYPAPRLISLPEPASPKPVFYWSPTTDRDTYNAAIEQIKDHIASGRTYQVNYTMRLQTEFKSDPWKFFLQLAQFQNNHAAYIDTGRYVVASASPELFFQLDGNTITGRPMKGTVKRGRTTLEDKEKAEWLRSSEKNRAENVMIVDMIRNDLGHIAKVGSVHVPELFTTEKYPTLWQMTSTVKANTSASVTNIFKALFPCASITGAPKISTMKIIADLETTSRKIYTGSIGYIAPRRQATFNVAIRTALIDKESQTAEYGVGGGIVWDSTSPDEYAEALLKARVLTEISPQFSLLETMLWTPREGFFLREKHIARLLDSAEYFDFQILRRGGVPSSPLMMIPPPSTKEIIQTYLAEISSHFTSPQRVRLLLDKKGKLSHEAGSFQQTNNDLPVRVCLAKAPVNSGNVFFFHKTTHREVYNNARKDFPDCDDVLLYNERGELTEFTICNLVVKLDGGFYSPPISCGLLPGTFRAHLLETGQVEERVVRVEEIKRCEKIFRVNSVRKWERVELIEN
jgi:para-aminobenzoate synthetase / 4-amino-4-deoxychorismate lyase